MGLTMADFLTHVLHSDAVLDRIESRRIVEGILKKKPLYRLGAQGPDTLFYDHCFPGKGKGYLKDLGETMHRHHTAAFLKAGFERLQILSWEEGWSDLAVYMSGFICHFTLDSLIHPYVYWACNHWIWTKSGTPAHTTHQRVELMLDALYWKEGRGVPASRVRQRKLIDIGKHWPDTVADFLKTSFLEVYGVETTSRELDRLLADCYRGCDLLYDPVNWKKSLIGWLDSLTAGAVRPAKVPCPSTVDDTIDWANRKKRSWFHPFSEMDDRTASADDILEEAACKASNHINILFSRLYRHEPIDDLFSNISYDTGLDCADPIDAGPIDADSIDESPT